MTVTSVIIPAFNCRRTISGAIQTVLEQRVDELEVIIVDDGSEDDLPAALKPFRRDVRLLRHAHNRGAAAARNTGLAAAAGDYIAFLDSDDIWKAGKLRKQLAFMKGSGFDVSCTGFDVASGSRISPVSADRPYGQRLGLDELVWGCYVSPGSTMIARKDLLLDANGYDSCYARLEDWDLLLRLAETGLDVGYLNEPLATIFPGGYNAIDPIKRSLVRLHAQHYTKLSNIDPKFARNLLAGISFELAAVQFRNRNYLKTSMHLINSLSRVPINNRSWEIIVKPHLPWLREGAGWRRPLGKGSKN